MKFISSSYRKILFWLILFIPFVIGSFRLTTPFLEGFQIPSILNNSISFDSANLYFPLNYFFKLFFLILPLISITLIEIYSFKRKGSVSLFNTSLGRIKLSKGYKLADVWYYVFFLFSNQFPLLVTIVSFGLATANSGLSNWFALILKNHLPYTSSNLLGLVIFTIAILFGDFFRYIRHRLSHEISFLWDQHEFHHSATQMTILSNFRRSHLEGILLIPLTLPLIPISIFFGLTVKEYLSKGILLPVIFYFIYTSFSLAAELIAHSSLKVIYPRYIAYFFMSPSLHWLHHSDNPKHFNTNFGVNFTFWDKLFGTYLDESHLSEINQVGIQNSKYNKHHPIYSYFVLPYYHFFRRLKNL